MRGVTGYEYHSDHESMQERLFAELFPVGTTITAEALDVARDSAFDFDWPARKMAQSDAAALDVALEYANQTYRNKLAHIRGSMPLGSIEHRCAAYYAWMAYATACDNALIIAFEKFRSEYGEFDLGTLPEGGV